MGQPGDSSGPAGDSVLPAAPDAGEAAGADESGLWTWSAGQEASEWMPMNSAGKPTHIEAYWMQRVSAAGVCPCVLPSVPSCCVLASATPSSMHSFCQAVAELDSSKQPFPPNYASSVRDGLTRLAAQATVSSQRRSPLPVLFSPPDSSREPGLFVPDVRRGGRQRGVAAFDVLCRGQHTPSHQGIAAGATRGVGASSPPASAAGIRARALCERGCDLPSRADSDGQRQGRLGKRAGVVDRSPRFSRPGLLSRFFALHPPRAGIPGLCGRSVPRAHPPGGIPARAEARRFGGRRSIHRRRSGRRAVLRRFRLPGPLSVAPPGAAGRALSVRGQRCAASELGS